MPPKKRPSASDYESDDGFVEDAPKSKKPKTTKTAKPEKPQTSAGETGAGTVAENGEVFWEVSARLGGEGLWVMGGADWGVGD